MQTSPKGTIGKSVPYNLFTAIDAFTNDTINLIHFKERLSKSDVKPHIEKNIPSHFMFTLANTDTFINIYSHFNLYGLLDRKRKTYIGHITFIEK